MRGNQKPLWACFIVFVLLLGPVTGAASAAEKGFIAPVRAEIIRDFQAPSSRFGPGHRGIDYGVPPGTSVKASGAGTVSFAGPVAADGLFVAIDHLGGTSTTYSFLSRVDVYKADRVVQGQVIGASGKGHAGEVPSLHFGAKLNGDYIDPKLLLTDPDDIRDLLRLTPLRAAAPPPARFSPR